MNSQTHPVQTISVIEILVGDFEKTAGGLFNLRQFLDWYCYKFYEKRNFSVFFSMISLKKQQTFLIVSELIFLYCKKIRAYKPFTV